MKTKTVVVYRLPVKLEQFLKFAGACASGGEAKARILQRQVRLNGSVCTQRGKKIQPGDQVFLDDTLYVAEFHADQGN